MSEANEKDEIGRRLMEFLQGMVDQEVNGDTSELLMQRIVDLERRLSKMTERCSQAEQECIKVRSIAAKVGLDYDAMASELANLLVSEIKKLRTQLELPPVRLVKWKCGCKGFKVNGYKDCVLSSCCGQANHAIGWRCADPECEDMTSGWAAEFIGQLEERCENHTRYMALLTAFAPIVRTIAPDTRVFPDLERF